MGLFGKKKKFKGIEWNENGWTTIQESDPAKHILTIICRAENGVVVEVRTRHTQGEEVQGEVTYEGKKAIPMQLDTFRALLEQGKLEIK